MAVGRPHKPLMLLLALARVGLGPKGRLIAYETADKRFRELWRVFGRPGAPPRAYYPFGRLRHDDRLWEIPEESQLSTGRGQDLRVSEAKRLGITGGFRQDVHDLLCRHPELVSRAARRILSEHFPPSIHQDILEAVRIAADAPSLGLDEPMPRRGRKVRDMLTNIGGIPALTARRLYNKGTVAEERISCRPETAMDDLGRIPTTLPPRLEPK